jgi:uncharacterized protein YqeY
MTDDLTARLRAALPPAMRARDTAAVTALRSALAAIANAEAVPTEAPSGTFTAIGAGSALGVGATEAPRRDLTAADIAAIVRAEIADRRTAAEEYDQHGRADHAARLRAEADVLHRLLAA